MYTPFFSVITPVYNNEHSIIKTIGSVKTQTIPDWEHIIVDDNSTDNSVNVIRGLCKENSRLKYYRNNRKKGANSCRNIGLEKAAGEYVIFLDGDDMLADTCLEHRKQIIDYTPPNIDIVISHTIFYDPVFDKSIGLFKCPQNLSTEEIIAAFIKHNILWTTTSPTWKKTFLKKVGGWNENYPRLQDVELNIRALMHRPQISYLHTPDSYLIKSGFGVKKQYAAFIGFNLLLRDYFDRIMESTEDEEITRLFNKAFLDLIKIITRYWQVLKIQSDDEWGAYFLDTLKSVLDENDFCKINTYLKKEGANKYRNNIPQ